MPPETTIAERPGGADVARGNVGIFSKYGELAYFDGIRAIAIIAVHAFHAHIPGFRSGFVGVDVIFVISGFLITRQIASQMLNGHFRQPISVTPDAAHSAAAVSSHSRHSRHRTAVSAVTAGGARSQLVGSGDGGDDLELLFRLRHEYFATRSEIYRRCAPGRSGSRSNISAGAGVPGRGPGVRFAPPLESDAHITSLRRWRYRALLRRACNYDQD